ncbi:hypothetical protein ACFLQN_04630 [Candidatus Aenigmatarchaeota archaeon]
MKLSIILILFSMTFVISGLATALPQERTITVDLTNPDDGSIVHGIVQVEAHAISSVPFIEDSWASPISFVISGEDWGIIIMQPDLCIITYDEQYDMHHAWCMYEWDSTDFEGEDVHIGAHAGNEEGHHAHDYADVIVTTPTLSNQR